MCKPSRKMTHVFEIESTPGISASYRLRRMCAAGECIDRCFACVLLIPERGGQDEVTNHIGILESHCQYTVRLDVARIRTRNVKLQVLARKGNLDTT